jgi:hypothetical protein
MSLNSCSDASTMRSHMHIEAAKFLNFLSKKWGTVPPLQNVWGPDPRTPVNYADEGQEKSSCNHATVRGTFLHSTDIGLAKVLQLCTANRYLRFVLMTR